MSRGVSTLVAEGRIVYPCISGYMADNHMTCKELADRVGVAELTMALKLKGVHGWKKWEIDAILGMIGLPYEVVFREREKNDKN